MYQSSFDDISDPDNLLKGFNRSKKGVDWKGTVQYFQFNLLPKIVELSKKLANDTYEQKKFSEFVLNERGKERHIKAVCIDDRVVQRTLCDQALVPELSEYLIYDNGASIKNKGLSFARARFKHHLHNYWINNGKSSDGYVLMIDFSKYFDNINHEILENMVSEKIVDERIIDLFKKIVKSFEVDVSFMSDEEYSKCMEYAFDTLKYDYKTSKPPVKVMKKSLGIGSQVSQISGVYYPSPIDNYCKIVKQIKYYGRYMDDTYIISNSKEYLKELLNEIKEICDSLGIFINMKKTQIIKLSKGVKFLQITYKIKEDGRIIELVNEKTIVRERRKLKKHYDKFIQGEMKIDKIYNMYTSWRGEYIKYDSTSSIFSLDELFETLFGDYVHIYLAEKEKKDKVKYNFYDYTERIYT